MYIQLVARQKKLPLMVERNVRKKTPKDNPHIFVAAVHCKPTIHRECQFREQIRIQSNASEHLTKDWKNDRDLHAVSGVQTAFYGHAFSI